MQRIRVGIVGLGKIALEEHVPALRSNPRYELAACVSTVARLQGVPCYASVGEMLDDGLALDAVAICTPPQAHYEAARCALERGKHVLMEKPPCPTMDQFSSLVALAQQSGCTLFQTWHARETPAVDAVAQALKVRQLQRGRVIWKEDVRQWHPGQAWIWREGGFGVLDAGINAISVLTKILPDNISVESARLSIPANCECPIAAAVVFRTGRGAIIDAEFDFRHTGEQTRSIHLDTEVGTFSLTKNVAEFDIDGTPVALPSQDQEYGVLYRRFAELVAERHSDTDSRPLELVLDVFRLAERETVAPFEE